MLIIFQPNLNKNPRLQSILLFILLTFCCCGKCQNQTQFVYTTLYTNCQITMSKMQSPANNNASSSQYQFKECKITMCHSLGTGKDCRENTTIGLEKQNCFWSCCRMHYFDYQQCLANNSELEAKSQQMDRYLIIVLASCTLALVVIIMIFTVKDLKCFEKEKLQLKNITPIWKQAKYEDHKCNICEQYGAVVQTNCKHFFHLECFKKQVGKKEIKGQCLTCDQISKRYRLWCHQCHQRYIKVGYSQMKTIDVIEQYYNQSMILHDDCLKDLYCCAKTDFRITSSTND